MSRKGGYKIINLKGKELIGEGITIKGIYDAIESNYGKLVVISGIVINGVEKADITVGCVVDDGNFVFNGYGYNFTVTDDDEITIEEIVPPAPVSEDIVIADFTGKTWDETASFEDETLALAIRTAYKAGKAVYMCNITHPDVSTTKLSGFASGQSSDDTIYAPIYNYAEVSFFKLKIEGNKFTLQTI